MFKKTVYIAHWWWRMISCMHVNRWEAWHFIVVAHFVFYHISRCQPQESAAGQMEKRQTCAALLAVLLELTNQQRVSLCGCVMSNAHEVLLFSLATYSALSEVHNAGLYLICLLSCCILRCSSYCSGSKNRMWSCLYHGTHSILY